MPTLILLRHAKAEPDGPTDFERPLALRGREQAREVAAQLNAGGLIPGVVLCSAALRTRQTWAVLSAGLEHGPAPVVHDLEELYSATPETVRAAVAEHGGQSGTLLVVGHEPIMSMTAAQYAGEGSDPAAVLGVRAGMPTASMAIIELDDWAARQGTLRALQRV